MIEANADLWAWPADVRVITTNGTVRADGRAVMGRGCAKQAKDKFPGIDLVLGQHLRHGNRVVSLGRVERKSPGLGVWLWTCPVKHDWADIADIALIRRSVERLVMHADQFAVVYGRVPRIVMPRPGCGNGQLQWEDVKPVLADLLDDRFTVVHLAPVPV